MPHHPNIKTSGTVTDVFGHRFVIETAKGRILADIGPEAADTTPLNAGDRVEIEGERRPSEVKVHRISVGGAHAVEAHRRPKDHDHGSDFGEHQARRIAEKAGFKILGNLTPHKRHFEALAEHDGARHDIHIHRDHIMTKHKLL